MPPLINRQKLKSPSKPKPKLVGWILDLFHDFGRYLNLIRHYAFWRSYKVFTKFEKLKDAIATNLYKQRGRFARPFIHTGMMMIIALSIMLTPVIAQNSQAETSTESPMPQFYSAFEDPETQTTVSDKPRDKVIHYVVASGDTLSTIASKFDVSTDTIRWQNKLGKNDQIKPGQTLEILPVTGVSHRVQKGDTIYSIAKKYGLESAQPIVDFPFNSFSNDETFALAIGQTIIVPDGNMPSAAPSFVARRTPDAGSVTASGQFVWPTNGTITQRFFWYHKGIDIANKAAPAVVAADAGEVIVAGWPDSSGYGNRVMIDHGNGYITLYAHLSKIYVGTGQRVNRGDAIGQMGSTGRSTGTHLHFEIRTGSGNLNPLNFLK